MSLVSHLKISEKISLHAESFRLLQNSLGDVASQDVIERAIVEVAERIGSIEQSLLLSDLEHLRKTARGLAAISQQLGLLALARVAQDAVSCIDKPDINALHAVTHRLVRVGDASLAAAIDGAALPM